MSLNGASDHAIGSGPAARQANGTPSIALFAYGFRPFFLLAAAYAVLGVVAWLLILDGVIAPTGSLPPIEWHAHEMVFGFVLAGICGFYLTAIPNWTGAAPVRGGRLALLVALWLIGRLAMWSAGVLPPVLVAAAQLALLPMLAAFVLPALIAARQPRNAVFLVIPAALEGAALLVQLDVLGLVTDGARLGLQLGIDLALLLITVIGGRIVPTFTGNALRARGETALPRSRPWLDRLAIASMLALALADLMALPALIGAVALVAAAANAARLAGWRSARTLDAPLLWVLHLGYAWLVAGLALKAAAALGLGVPPTAALHALTVGAIGKMMLAVMSRAALGHTGRPLAAHPVTVAAYALVSLAALLRIGAAFAPETYLAWIVVSGVLWSAGFAAFLAVYAPILVRPRRDGMPG